MLEQRDLKLKGYTKRSPCAQNRASAKHTILTNHSYTVCISKIRFKLVSKNTTHKKPIRFLMSQNWKYKCVCDVSFTVARDYTTWEIIRTFYSSPPLDNWSAANILLIINSHSVSHWVIDSNVFVSVSGYRHTRENRIKRFQWSRNLRALGNVSSMRLLQQAENDYGRACRVIARLSGLPIITRQSSRLSSLGLQFRDAGTVRNGKRGFRKVGRHMRLETVGNFSRGYTTISFPAKNA